jgi:hypothetical protein
MPLIIRLNGISADAGRDLNTQLYYNKAVRANRGAFFFRVSSFEKKSAAGTAWALKFTLLRDKFPEPALIGDYLRVAKDMGLLLTGSASDVPAAPAIDHVKEMLKIADKVNSDPDRVEKEMQAIGKNDVGKVEEVLPEIKF